MRRVKVHQIKKWKKAEEAWVTSVRRRLTPFEKSFQKHADICTHCYALMVWDLGTPIPKRCQRCKNIQKKNFNSLSAFPTTQWWHQYGMKVPPGDILS